MTVEQPIWTRSIFKLIALAMITLASPQIAFAADD
jgi:hypothetical protein